MNEEKICAFNHRCITYGIVFNEPSVPTRLPRTNRLRLTLPADCTRKTATSVEAQLESCGYKGGWRGKQWKKPYQTRPSAALRNIQCGYDIIQAYYTTATVRMPTLDRQDSRRVRRKRTVESIIVLPKIAAWIYAKSLLNVNPHNY